MADPRFSEFVAGELKQIREQGLGKEEWPLLGAQGPEIRVQGRDGPVLNFCAHNYLGLSSHPELLASAHRTLDEWGYGLSSVRMIVTDGVFSMDGDVAPLREICDLADRPRALVLVDDSHATGFMGKTGRGTPEHCGVAGRVDIITTTFGKALGGASGGCIAAGREIVGLL